MLLPQKGPTMNYLSYWKKVAHQGVVDTLGLPSAIRFERETTMPGLVQWEERDLPIGMWECREPPRGWVAAKDKGSDWKYDCVGS
uniref:Uncharacterized protein n=1 Tax=Timema genevievae TaxID=629358 RepID=A0A7R9JPZ9_TIMGE|nr:unnamed protein product [Timema genevievae]